MRARALALALALVAARAHAQPAEDPSIARYREGARLLQEGKAEQALVELRASEAIRPSPNARLLEGHALRTLGRRVEALAAYEDTVATAGARVREGEARYEATLADAGRWVAVLKTQLGEIVVEVRHAPPGSELAIDRAVVAASPDVAGTLRARAWHEPGAASVTVRAPDGTAREAATTIVPGTPASVVLELAAPAALAPSPTPPRPPPPTPSGGPPIGAYVAFGAGAVLLGVGAVFLAEMDRHSNALDACDPNCDPNGADGDHRSEGKRDATIAALAGGGALVAVAVGVVLLTMRPSSAAPAAAVALRAPNQGLRLAF